MSALGQKQTFCSAIGMSALPPIADMCRATRYVRFVPIADIARSVRLSTYCGSKYTQVTISDVHRDGTVQTMSKALNLVQHPTAAIRVRIF
jgi:hypothetical protein